MPRKKKQDDVPSLAGGVLVVPKPAPVNGHSDDTSSAPPASPDTSSSADEAAPAPEQRAEDTDVPGAWIGHRPLIRATLPKTENDVPPPRAIPEFTMHQRPGRGFGGRPFRHSGFGGSSNGFSGSNNGSGSGREPDGNRASGSGGGGGGGAAGGKGRHRRRHRRPR
jgi:hypothetical protein